ncbi:ATP-binding cassette domain-containing protein, partial [bacterium]
DEPVGGSVEVDGVDTRDAHPASLRRRVALVGDQPELFAGTIYENITIGREHVGPEDVRWALEMAGLGEDTARLSKGLSNEVRRGGGNLSTGFAQRLLLARAIVGRPRLLILDEAFTGIDERTKGEILDRIFDQAHGWTILDISHEIGVVMRTEVVHVLEGGRIVESGRPEELVRSDSSELARLFPTLGWLLREGARR